jgi:hypothetical protein
MRTARAAALLTAVAMASVSAPAAADGPTAPTGKGIAGGILLGAEIPMIVTAAIGVDDAWPYLLFGGVGAIGGGIGGYFVEQAGEGGGPAEPSLYMLAGGMALIIPTLVVTLNATAYDPSEDVEEGEEINEDPALQDEKSEGKRPPRSPRRALVEWAPAALRLGPPAVELRRSYTVQQQAMFGVRQTTEFHAPLVRATF